MGLKDRLVCWEIRNKWLSYTNGPVWDDFVQRTKKSNQTPGYFSNMFNIWKYNKFQDRTDFLREQ